MNACSELWGFACSKNGYQNIQLLMEQMTKPIPENVISLVKDVYNIKLRVEITIIFSYFYYGQHIVCIPCTFVSFWHWNNFIK